MEYSSELGSSCAELVFFRRLRTYVLFASILRIFKGEEKTKRMVELLAPRRELVMRYISNLTKWSNTKEKDHKERIYRS